MIVWRGRIFILVHFSSHLTYRDHMAWFLTDQDLRTVIWSLILYGPSWPWWLSFFSFVSSLACYDTRSIIWPLQHMLLFHLPEFICCKVLDFFFWTNDKRKIFESLISPRWAILEMLRKSGRKRSQPRSVATSWTERRRWFIYVLEMLLSACSMPRSLVTWA